MTLPPDLHALAEQVLTDKQLEAFELECAGWGLGRIGAYLDIRKQTVAGRLEGAHARLRKAGVRQDQFGKWTIDEEVAA